LSADSAEPAGVSRATLKAAALDGVRWMAFARLAAELVSVGSSVVLAHLVSPRQFGMLATAVVVRELALMTANEGVGSPIVQRRDLRRAHLEAGVLLALVIGGVLTLVALLVVPLATEPLFGAETTSLFRLFAPSFLLVAVMIVPLAQLQRELRFRRIGAIEVVGVLVSAAVSLALAIAGLEAKAYVLGMLAGLAVLAVGYQAGVPRVLPRWHRREAIDIWRFGVPATAAGLAGVGYRNVDYLLVGARLGPLLAGYYYRAFTLGVEYEAKITGVLARVTFPLYARTEDMDHLRSLRLRIVRLNATLIWPLLACFVVVAPVALPWVFGDRWTPAVVPAQLLAIAGMAATIRNGTSPLILAAGHPRALMGFCVVELIAYAGTVLVATSFGLTAVAAAVSAFQIVALCAAYAVMLGPLVGVPLRQLLRDVAPAGLSSAALVAITWPLGQALDGVLPAPVFVAAVGLVAAAVYVAMLRILFAAAWSDVALLAGSVLRRRRAEPAPPPGLVAAPQENEPPPRVGGQGDPLPARGPHMTAGTTVFDEAYFTGGSKSNYQDYEREAQAAIDEAFMPSIRRYAASARPADGPGASLDVGCAMGFYVERLAADGWRAHGIDISDYAIARGRARGLTTLQVASIGDLPFDDASFDYVTAIDVIEHLDPELAARAVAEVRRVLRPGGLTFFATPNHLDNAYSTDFTPGFLDPDRQHIYSQSLESLREAFAEFSACHVYGHTPFIGQFKAADASAAFAGRGLDLPIVRSFATRVGRRVAWRLLGRDPVYAAYLHAVAIR
jgi:PST family polysaccharide transporter